MSRPAHDPSTMSKAAEKFAQLTDPTPPPQDDEFVLSYLGLRRAVGIIGLALPVVLLVVGWLLDDGPMPGSMSAYYYTSMRNYFVGTLCALAVFLFSYKYAPRDNFLSTIASLCALGVVFFPTTPQGADSTWTGKVHIGCAMAFFFILAMMALFVFTRPPLRPTEKREARKRLRNKIYRACGYVILISMGLAFVLGVSLDDATSARLHPLFWLESVMVWAFSWSWLIKGGFLFKDRAPEPA
jgi:hypothetical protein